MGVDVSPQQRIEDMIRVTELCIDLLKENEEHHGEVCVSKRRFRSLKNYFICFCIYRTFQNTVVLNFFEIL